MDAINAWSADIKHPIWVLAQLNYAIAVGLGRCEVQVRHFCNAVADCIVKSTSGNLTTMDMRNRNYRKKSGACGRKQFKTIAQHQYKVGLQSIKCIGESD